MGKKKQVEVESKSDLAVDDIDSELDSILAGDDMPERKSSKKTEAEEDESFDDTPADKAAAEEDGIEEEAEQEKIKKSLKIKKAKATKETEKELEVTEHLLMNIDDITIPADLLRSVPEEEIEELAASIKHDGLLQPILISKSGALIAGYRRLMAHQKLGETQINVNVIDVDKDDHYTIALIENIQRKQLSTVDEGNAYKKLLEDKDRFPTQKSLAKALGISEAKVSLTLKAIGVGVSYDTTARKEKKEKSKPEAPKSHRMSEDNIPEGITVMVSKHEINLGIKLKIKSEAQAKSFDLKKEVAAILKAIDNKEFREEMSILREDL